MAKALPQDAWPPLTCVQWAVVDATAMAATGERQQMIPAIGIERVRVEMETPAADLLYGHLRPHLAATDKHLAEHQAVAIAAHDADLLLVLHDKRAFYDAAAELGPGRTWTPWDLWLWLRDQGLVGAEHFHQLCERTRRAHGQPQRPQRTLVNPRSPTPE